MEEVDSYIKENSLSNLQRRKLNEDIVIPIRQSSYVTLEKYMNKHVHVFLEAEVTKIDLKPNGKHIVEVLTRDGLEKFTARKEVVLSAGAVNSAKLLMQSGVGNCTYLETEHNITCKVPQNGLGSLYDTPLAYMAFISFELPQTMSQGAIIGFMIDRARYLKGEITTYSTPFFTIAFATVAHHDPSFNGELKLQDVDGGYNIYKKPKVAYNWYPNEDWTPIASAFKEMRDLFANLTGYQEIFPNDGVNFVVPNNIEAIASYLKRTAVPEIHIVRTAPVGRVVNPKFQLLDNAQRVIKNMRVADNSWLTDMVLSHGASANAMITGALAAQEIAHDNWGI